MRHADRQKLFFPLLDFVPNKHYCSINKVRNMAQPGNSWKIPWHLMLIFLLLSAGILTLGYFYYQYQADHFQREMEAQLHAIADLKVKQITAWRQERMHDANLIFDDPIFGGEVQEWLEGRAPLHRRKEILHRLQGLKQKLYESIQLFDLQGRVRLAIPEVKPEALPLLRKIALDTSSIEKVEFTDLYRVPGTQEIMISLAVPIHFHQGERIVFTGVVILNVDPHRFLYPLIQTWPTASVTAEFVLLRREGEDIVFLNELRHRQGTALEWRRPLAAAPRPAAYAGTGREGITRSLDYRGVPVLAATRIIPDSPWSLVAKIDTAEIAAPLREKYLQMAFLLFALIASSGAGVAYFWRDRDVLFYRQQYEAERESRALAQRYEYLAKNANDIILMVDQDLKVVEANARAVSSYGYSPEEFLDLHLADLYPQGRLTAGEIQVLEMKTKDGQTFETVHRRRDGTTFPVDISSSELKINGSRLYQMIIRDMTQTKEREKVLLESENQLRFLSSQLLLVQENERRRISKELHDELGLSLTVVKFQLSSLKDNLAKGRKVSDADFQPLFEYLNGVIENVRRLSWDLSPGALEELGLATAVKNLLEEFDRHYDLRWSPAELQEINNVFSPLAQVNIYRIFQESLTNIERHAQATQITVDVSRQDHQVTFTIEDNGRGFPLYEVYSREHQEKGIGLTAMQERARLAGGFLTIHSQPGAGTKIRFSIPTISEEATDGPALSHLAG